MMNIDDHDDDNEPQNTNHYPKIFTVYHSPEIALWRMTKPSKSFAEKQIQWVYTLLKEKWKTYLTLAKTSN